MYWSLSHGAVLVLEASQHAKAHRAHWAAHSLSSGHAQAKVAVFKQREKVTEKTKKLSKEVLEKVDAVPKFLNGRQLRDYQIISLQWMMSNFRNKKNCILGDEMVRTC
jgi:SNF2 family DNA or RNA helicase